MKSIIFSFLVVICLISACSESSSPTKHNDEIFPLAIGNKWVYQKTLGNGFDTTCTYQIMMDTILNNEKWYGYGCTLLQNNESGLWAILIDDSSTNRNPTLFYKYPALAGQEYEYTDIKVKVISINEEVTVPAGKFICYHYRFPLYKEEYLEVYMDYYLSPGVGMVKVEEYDWYNGYLHCDGQVLVSYDIK